MVKKNRSAEEVQKAYDSVPQEIRAIIDGPELVSLIPTIGAKHQLHVDQMGVLEGEITDVLIGFENTKDFTANIERGLGIDKTKANAITQDVNDLLFLKIRESMKKISSMEEKSVMMPSATNSSAVQIPLNTAPAQTTSMTAPIPPKLATPPAPMPPAKPAELHAADLMLSEPTVSMAPKPAAPVVPPAPAVSAPISAPPPTAAKVEPPKPAPYKADPYREPPE